MRVIQRDGKVIAAEDFTPLVSNAHLTRSASASGVRTKSQLMQKRRDDSVVELHAVYGDL